MLSKKIKKTIDQKNENLLVIGPPGTGKTHTLINIIKYLVETKKVDPRKVLVFCFNRRWAKIVREKSAKLIGTSIFEVPIETFYSFCIDLLDKVNAIFRRCYLPIKVLNSVQQWKLLKEIVENVDRKDYPYTYKLIRQNPFTAQSYIQEVFDFILRAQENLLSPQYLSEKFTPFLNPTLAEIVGIYARYKNKLYQENLYNYGRLLEEAANLLSKDEKIKKFFRQEYEWILVDEVQEINKAQFEIVRCLADRNCIYFGNDDESIYTFRGSMVDNFKHIYENLEPDNVLFLKINYRSSPILNKACQSFILLNKNRIKKESLVCKENSFEDEEFMVKRFPSLLEETSFICRKIKELCLNEGLGLEDIAIIVKGLGYETHIIENSLKQNNIPFARRGSRNLLDDAFVKYILNFMELVLLVKDYEKEVREAKEGREASKANEAWDLIHKLNSIIETLLLSNFVNLNPLYFEKLKSSYINSYTRENKGISINFLEDLWGALTNLREEVRGKFSQNDSLGYQCEGNKIKDDKSKWNPELKKIIDFVDLVKECTPYLDKPVYYFMAKLLRDKRFNYIGYLESSGLPNKSPLERSSRDNLRDFLESIKDFCKTNQFRNDVGCYIEFINNILENRFLEEVEESTKDFYTKGVVHILSFHQCKGLEFKAVFLPFINRNYLPSKLDFPQSYDKQIFNYFSIGKTLDFSQLIEKHIEEERKLFYVGLTRSSKYLYITSNQHQERSIFFDELEGISKKLYQKKEKELKHRLNDLEKKKKKIVWDFVLNTKWKVRKRAIVSTYRLLNSLPISLDNYFRQLFFLGMFYPPQEWWGFTKPTKNNYNPFLLSPPVFSYSSLNTFKECPFKYNLRYFLGLEDEEDLSLKVGKIYHQILNLFFKSYHKEQSWENLEKILVEAFASQYFDFPFLKRELMEKAKEEFRNFFFGYLPAKPEASIVEKDFSFCLGGDYITGRIDQINFYDDDTIELIDYKSSSTRPSPSKLEEEIQLKVYMLALSLSEDLLFLKDKKPKLKYFLLGQLSNPSPNPICEVPEECCDLDEISTLIKGLISRIKNEDFNPLPESYMTCKSCNYRILCPKYYGTKY